MKNDELKRLLEEAPKAKEDALHAINEAKRKQEERERRQEAEKKKHKETFQLPGGADKENDPGWWLHVLVSRYLLATVD